MNVMCGFTAFSKTSFLGKKDSGADRPVGRGCSASVLGFLPCEEKNSRVYSLTQNTYSSMIEVYRSGHPTLELAGLTKAIVEV